MHPPYSKKIQKLTFAATIKYLIHTKKYTNPKIDKKKQNYGKKTNNLKKFFSF